MRLYLRTHMRLGFIKGADRRKKSDWMKIMIYIAIECRLYIKTVIMKAIYLEVVHNEIETAMALTNTKLLLMKLDQQRMSNECSKTRCYRYHQMVPHCYPQMVPHCYPQMVPSIKVHAPPGGVSSIPLALLRR